MTAQTTPHSLAPRSCHRRRRVHVVALLLAGTIGACGGAARSGPGVATAEETLNELFNLSSVYRRLGRLASGAPMPFIGSVAYFGGRNDSTIAHIGLSLDNRSLSFQRGRGGAAFEARYRVEVVFLREGTTALEYGRDETVVVGSFTEAQRSDETIVFQQGFLIAPGLYQVTVSVTDLNAATTGHAEQALDVPGFERGTMTAPILVYQARDRSLRTDALGIILNPRGTVAQGGDSLQIYVEAYGLLEPQDLDVEVRDDRDSLIHRSTLSFVGKQEVESHIVKLAPEAPPLGELAITLGAGTEGRRTSALVSFSRSWVVTNYDNLLSLLRFFGYDERLDALRKATAGERPSLWRAFWLESDPNPATSENEALDLYFTRLAIANERYKEDGSGVGWRTDRGEVYITLGDPDQVLESPPSADIRVMQWVYSNYRAVLTFQGQFGFSRLRLTPGSRAEFSRVRALVQRQGAE